MTTQTRGPTGERVIVSIGSSEIFGFNYDFSTLGFTCKFCNKKLDVNNPMYHHYFMGINAVDEVGYPLYWLGCDNSECVNLLALQVMASQ